MKTPLVSVIIPVFNRADLLGKALQSVSEQTFSDWEVVVVDDCSSDGSAQTALRSNLGDKVRVVRHEINRGPSAARNTGIREARGRYISFLDSDDLWCPEKLNRQVELVTSDSDPANVLCATQTLVLMGGKRKRIRPERPPARGEPWSEFLYVADGFAQTNSFFVSRDLALKVPFRESVLQHEDNLFFLEAGAHGARYRLIKEALSIWNHDPREGRMGRSPDLERSYTFLAEAGELLTKKARMAFEVRYLGPLLFRESPIDAMKLCLRATRNGGVRPRQLIGVALRCGLSEHQIETFRQLLFTLRIS